MRRFLREHWIWIVAPLVLGAAAIAAHEIASQPDDVGLRCYTLY